MPVDQPEGRRSKPRTLLDPEHRRICRPCGSLRPSGRVELFKGEGGSGKQGRALERKLSRVLCPRRCRYAANFYADISGGNPRRLLASALKRERVAGKGVSGAVPPELAAFDSRPSTSESTESGHRPDNVQHAECNVEFGRSAAYWLISSDGHVDRLGTRVT